MRGTRLGEFPIVDGSGRPRGLLTRDALIGALREAGPASPVLDSMVREVPSLPAWRPLEAGLATLTQAKAPALFVLDDAGRLAGVITPENVGEMMLVRSARPDFRFRRLAGHAFRVDAPEGGSASRPLIIRRVGPTDVAEGAPKQCIPPGRAALQALYA